MKSKKYNFIVLNCLDLKNIGLIWVKETDTISKIINIKSRFKNKSHYNSKFQ